MQPSALAQLRNGNLIVIISFGAAFVSLGHRITMLRVESSTLIVSCWQDYNAKLFVALSISQHCLIETIFFTAFFSRLFPTWNLNQRPRAVTFLTLGPKLHREQHGRGISPEMELAQLRVGGWVPRPLQGNSYSASSITFIIEILVNLSRSWQDRYLTFLFKLKHCFKSIGRHEFDSRHFLHKFFWINLFVVVQW